MPTRTSVVDNFVSYVADRALYARDQWDRVFKAHESTLPMYLSESSDWYNRAIGGSTLEERMRIALTISWIYADVKLIASEFSSVPLKIKHMDDERKETIVDHPFQSILDHPNSEMDLPFLLQYLAYWITLRGKAYWYLAPEAGNPDVIKEIWPIRSDRIWPIVGKQKFVEQYVYRLNSGETIKIDPRYVVFFRYPNPYDLWDGLSPLSAWLPVETERGLAQWQKDAYTTGRGIPHSIVALDKNLSETDFIVAAARIREDFEHERKVAITRSGDLDVKTVGITPKELELIKSREFTRDEIDTIFLGVPIRDHSSDVWLEAADKLVKEKTIWPLHVLVAGQISVQVLQSFYGDVEYVEFDDIRPQDRALNVQEANIYWRVHTVDEAREKLGMPKIEIPEYKGKFSEVEMLNYGSLPVPLATDPSFVTLLYDIGRVSPDELNLPGSADTLDRFLDKVNLTAQNRQLAANKPPAQPGLRQAESPKHMNNRVATQGTAVQQGKKSELQRWRKVASKELQAGRDPSERDFASDILTDAEIDAIKSALAVCDNETDIKALFSSLIYQGLPLEEEITTRSPDTHITIPGVEVKSVVDTSPIAEALLTALDIMKASVPAPIIHVNVPEQQAPNIIVNVPESVVNVNVPQQEPPIVNVAPAEVTVNVPEQKPPVVNVEVPKAEVTVQNEVNFPHEQTEEAEVERNAQGQIVRVRKTKRFGG